MYLGNVWNNIKPPVGILRSTVDYLNNEIRLNKIIYPNFDLLFRSYWGMLDVPKVVIVGQDPYYSGRMEFDMYVPFYTGLAFEVNTVSKAQSLQVLQKLMIRDDALFYGYDNNVSQPNKLDYLSNQNVMLTNMILSVEHGLPGSHSMVNTFGTNPSPYWEEFTKYMLGSLSYLHKYKPMVFILFGRLASTLKQVIQANHLVIEAPHPARTNMKAYANIFPFAQTNEYLSYRGRDTIRWTYGANI